MHELARRGHTVHWPGDPTFQQLRNGAAPAWDAFHMQQMHDEEALEVMQRVRRAGIAVVWDTDDDISAVTRGSEAWHRLGGRRNIKRHFKAAMQAARIAHLVTTTNENLAQVYRDNGAEHVVAIENYLAPQDVGHAARVTRGSSSASPLRASTNRTCASCGSASSSTRLLDRHDGVRVVALGADLRLRNRHRY